MVFTPGQVLKNGEYTVERELGRGRFGITYLAKRADGERWVIKILNPSVLSALADDERDRLETMFWQEAVKLAKCSGTPHIVQSEMPFKEGKVVCLPMEYMDGNSLADRGQQQLTEATALEYIKQIGEALAVVHKQGLVHCDIRPANIFLRLHGNQAKAVLTDFGLARGCDTELTRTRTDEYMDGFSPPELCSRGKVIGPYTDVYSLAATLYELLTGKIPVSALDRSLKNQTLSPPKVWLQTISEKTSQAIVAGMAIKPGERPQSMLEWLTQLDFQKRAQFRLPRSNASPKSGQQPKQPTDWQKWSTIIAGLGIIVAILAMVPAWLALNQPKNQAPPSPASSAKPTP
ncbi:serine/threonine protein kinase [filamentous cyanobacterium LEGE 11480]|uniref:Serine/threonine protein kinase n=1 Tax=Romeriopsis navalis LEGE 11480 TaxID=2777977 RepID=A0A928Z7C2_9CYAN|nr:serine/threonine-protein kinase [Romeriopsis navalis]MBE9033050.1 serine/threonine protein kinase [Romeriopsis navalis LEGE 11480]